MPRAVTIENVGQAFAVLKEMQAEGLVWGEDHRSLGRTALARLIEKQMAAAIERHLEQMAEPDEGRSPQRQLFASLADGVGRYRAVRAAHAPLQRRRGAARLCPARG